MIDRKEGMGMGKGVWKEGIGGGGGGARKEELEGGGGGKGGS